MELLETDGDSYSSKKYFLNCQGILEKYGEVVIKLGNTDTIENEWIIYNKLKDNKVPGVLKYYCYFHCSEDFGKLLKTFRENIDYKPTHLCNGSGTNLKVLLMDFGIHNLADFPWKTTESLQSCIKQSLLTVLQGYVSFGLYHEDCHPRNFIIKKTTKKLRKYNINGNDIDVPIYGYETCMMDLEGSKQNYTEKGIYTDLWNFCSMIENQMGEKINAQSNQQNRTQLYNMKLDLPPFNLTDILDMVSNISQSITLVQANIEGGRYRLPWRNTKLSKTRKTP